MQLPAAAIIVIMPARPASRPAPAHLQLPHHHAAVHAGRQQRRGLAAHARLHRPAVSWGRDGLRPPGNRVHPIFMADQQGRGCDDVAAWVVAMCRSSMSGKRGSGGRLMFVTSTCLCLGFGIVLSRCQLLFPGLVFDLNLFGKAELLCHNHTSSRFRNPAITG